MLRATQLFAEILKIRKQGSLLVHKVKYLGREATAAAWYPFGYFANASAGSIARIVFIGGKSEQRVVLPTSTDAPDSEETECGIYHPETGTKIHFKANGDIDVETVAGQNVNVICNELNTMATTTLLQDATASDDVLQIVEDLALMVKAAAVTHNSPPSRPMDTATQAAAQLIADRASAMRT